MSEDHQQHVAPPSSPSQPNEPGPLPTSSTPPPPFDPSRSIIKRKALIKELAATYHQECLTYCHQLLELQQNKDEPFIELEAYEDPRKEMKRSSKRAKKTR